MTQAQLEVLIVLATLTLNELDKKLELMPGRDRNAVEKFRDMVERMLGEALEMDAQPEHEVKH